MSTTSFRHPLSIAPSLLRCCTFKMPLSFMKGLLHLSIENFVCIAVGLFVCMHVSVPETYVAFRKTGFCKVQQ